MALQYSDTSTYNGIIQVAEREAGFKRGTISGDTDRLKEATVTVNLAWDDYVNIALKASGRWNFDDSNQTDYPIIYTNLVSGQRDYTFTTDGSGNFILDIFKAAILPSSTATLYQEISPIDQQTADDSDEISVESSAQGVPSAYDKTGNGIFLDIPTDYNATNGLKLWVNRTASYFAYTDTTKKPGCPAIHHRYFALKIALDLARENDQANYTRLQNEVQKYEGNETIGLQGEIERYFSRRDRAERAQITPKLTNYV